MTLIWPRMTLKQRDFLSMTSNLTPLSVSRSKYVHKACIIVRIMDLTLIWPLFDLFLTSNDPDTILFTFNDLEFDLLVVFGFEIYVYRMYYCSDLWFDLYLTLIWPQMTLKHKFVNSAQKMHSIGMHNLCEIRHIESTFCILTSWSLIAFISRMHEARTFSLSKMKSLGSNYPG